MSDRSTEIFAAVDQFNRTHDEWANNKNSEYPTLAYWESLAEMVNTIESGDLPANCRRLATAVYELAAEQAKFDMSGQIEIPQSFWAARENLANSATLLRSPDEHKHLETIVELDRQKVPHEQIGRMWGLVHRDGSGNIGLVQKELAKPGSVITSNYVHPSDVEAKQETDIARAKFLLLAQQVPSESMGTVDNDPPCPESSFDLWLQKVPPRQASLMLKRDESSVASEWAAFQEENTGVGDTAVAIAGTDAIETPLPIGDDIPASVPPLETSDVELGDEVDDGTTGFEDWTDEEIKAKAEEMLIKVPKKFNRDRIIDKILEVEADAEAQAAASET